MANGRVITPDEVFDPGWIEVVGNRIAGLGSGDPPLSADVDLAGSLVAPGFVDTHVHGGGGAFYPAADPAAARQVAAFHLRHGTTTAYASLISASLPDLDRQVRILAELVADGVVAGIHLEGPWLSASRCGAHDPRLLRDPAPDEIERLLRAGAGRIRMVTLAPELEGGVPAVRQVVDAGVLAAVGHTDAPYDVVRAAVGAGATIGTHLFNGMRPIHHRDPGPIVALLEDPGVVVELITDGVHLHRSVVALAVQAAGPDQVALVTDAMAAAGMADGSYDLGGRGVLVRDGVARLAEGGSIAGSTLTMDAAFRFVVEQAGLSLVEAARVAATSPARAHGLTDVGALRQGLRADLVTLDDSLRVVGVMRSGTWVELLGELEED